MLQQPAVLADATAPSTTTPPIVQIFQLAINVASKSLSVALLLSSSLWSLARTTLSPVLSFTSLAASPILYLLGPVIVLSAILFDILIVSPYHMFVSGAKTVYPLYVFVGIACICASCIGLCARGLTHALQQWAVGSAGEEKTGPLVEGREEGEVVSEPPSRKGKRVVIKEERDSD